MEWASVGCPTTEAAQSLNPHRLEMGIAPSTIAKKSDFFKSARDKLAEREIQIERYTSLQNRSARETQRTTEIIMNRMDRRII